MNLSTKLNEIKQQRQRNAAQRSRADAAPSSPWRRRLLILGLCAASAVATFLIVDRFFLAGMSRAVVGLWGVDGGPQDGATLELFRDGSFRANINDRGKAVPVQGRYAVEGKRITFYTKNPATEKEDPLTKTIEHVDADELRLRDASGEVMKLVRLTEENRP